MKVFKIISINLILTFLLMEIALNFYNPFGFRLKGNNIILENNHVNHMIVDNKEIIHSKNSLGFRGPELSDDQSIKLITVGGSTTENYHFDDSKTWSKLFDDKLSLNLNKNLWVNNAGLDGHSTFGHIKLIEDYIIKIEPDLILFLVGANDVGLDKENSFDIVYDFRLDNILTIGNQRHLKRNIGSFLATKSELFSLLLNLYRYYIKTEFNHSYSSFDSIIISKIDYNNHPDVNTLYPFEDFINESNHIKDNLLPQYSERIIKIIELSKEYKFKPIFITQPTITGGNAAENYQLKKITRADKFYLDLEIYNDELRRITTEYKIDLIDLASLMPKNENYYADKIHHTEEGLNFISDFVANYFIKNCESIFDKKICI